MNSGRSRAKFDRLTQNPSRTTRFVVSSPASRTAAASCGTLRCARNFGKRLKTIRFRQSARDRRQRRGVKRHTYFARDGGQRVNLGAREEQSARLVAAAREFRLRLAGQHARFVAVAEDVGDDVLHVLRLRTPAREGAAVQGANTRPSSNRS